MVESTETTSRPSIRDETDETTDKPYPPNLEDVPASCEVVYLILENAEGPLTQKELCEKTPRPSGTIKYALGRLRDETDLLEERPSGDGRQSFYSIQ